MKVMSGEIKRLIVSAPPRHGKSQLISGLFPLYFMRVFDRARVMLTTYEAKFAATWGETNRNNADGRASEIYGTVVDKGHNARDNWKLLNNESGMVTVGMGGALTGKGADLLIIDDPIKNQDEALSEIVQQSHEDWWYSSAKTRLEPGAAVIITATRWSERDLIGRILDREGDEWTVVNYPALAEEDDILGREVGEALWPERYDRETLEAIRKANPFWFAALYQGHPRPRGASMFQREWFAGKIVREAPRRGRRIRHWDFAATTNERSDWTVGVRMSTVDGRFFIEDVERHRLSPNESDARMRKVAEDDHEYAGWTPQRGEQEPGSAGIKQATAFAKLMVGFDVKSERPTGPKEVRARAFASQCEAGNVYLVAGDWIPEYLKELEDFPHGKHDDQVDASSGAFNDLLGRKNPGRALAGGTKRAPAVSARLESLFGEVASGRHRSA